MRSGYATGDLSFTPASLGMKQKEVFSVEADVEAEAFGDSDDVHEIETHNSVIHPCIVPSESNKRKSIDSRQAFRISSKRSREEDIDACLDQLRRSSVIQSSRPKNPYDEVLLGVHDGDCCKVWGSLCCGYS